MSWDPMGVMEAEAEDERHRRRFNIKETSMTEKDEAQIHQDMGITEDEDSVSKYAELETKLKELRDSFLLAAEQTTNSMTDRSYRCGLSDGFNIALLMLRQTNASTRA